MGGPLSAIMADIWMIKLENNLIKPCTSELYKRYVDDVFTRRKRNVSDELFANLNS